ncbi:MAG: MTH938/NDUFAF3 family protein [Candidatus Eisenbacteria bacterium]
MRIEAYDFGTITVDGRIFTKDLRIIAGKVVPDWWRIEGHMLLPPDIDDILTAEPEVLVIGTGDPGMMKVSDVDAGSEKARPAQRRHSPAFQSLHQLSVT